MLPQVSGQQVVRALAKIGYLVVRQKGSHMILRGGAGVGITVPNHTTIAPGTLRAIIRAAGLSVQDFIDLL